MFTCLFGKYDQGNEVVFYPDLKVDFQKFKANTDGTISPLLAPEMVLGIETTSGSDICAMD